MDSSNSDFSMTFPSNGIVTFSGSTLTGTQTNGRDGAIQINYEDIETFIGVSQGVGNVILSIGTLTYDAVISGSAPFTASLFEDDFSDDVGGGDNYTNTIPFGEGFPSDSNNKVTISSEMIAFGDAPVGSNPGKLFRWQIKGTSGESGETMDYFFLEFAATMNVFYTATTGGNISIPTGGGNIISTTLFQGAQLNTQDFSFATRNSTDRYPRVKIQAHLKRTGSGIPPEGYIITSSNQSSFTDLFGGTTFEFPDSPILNIHQPDPTFQNTTINNENDMYYIEYSMSNYNDMSLTANEEFDVDFIETGDTGSKIIIEQRAVSTAASGYDLSGSVVINQGDREFPNLPIPVGNAIFSEDFSIYDETSTGRINLTGSFTHTFTHKDAFRIGMNVSKSFGAGLTITEYTMSIFPSSSVYAPLNSPPEFDLYKEPTSSGFIIPTYFGEGLLPFNRALDCQPTLNNYNDIRLNSYIMDVDYTNVTGSITPVNQEQLINNTAVKASLPDSNYTSLKSINPRYNGVKTTSNRLNVWTIKDTNTYGQNPVIELRDAYFGYFKNIKDLYPLVNDKISLELTYLLDEQSNAIPPSLEEYGTYILESTFPITNNVTLGFISASNLTQELDDSYPIFKLTQQAIPIFYTQTSSAGHATEIPLTGSGRISMYDNNDSTTFTDYSFTAQGTASFADNPGPNQSSGIYTQVIDPTEDITINPYSAGNYSNPYSGLDGIMNFSTGNTEKKPTNNIYANFICY